MGRGLEGTGESRLTSRVYSADKVDQHASNAEFHERRKSVTERGERYKGARVSGGGREVGGQREE